jgi:hypothetical protein
MRTQAQQGEGRTQTADTLRPNARTAGGQCCVVTAHACTPLVVVRDASLLDQRVELEILVPSGKGGQRDEALEPALALRPHHVAENGIVCVEAVGHVLEAQRLALDAVSLVALDGIGLRESGRGLVAQQQHLGDAAEPALARRGRHDDRPLHPRAREGARGQHCEYRIHMRGNEEQEITCCGPGRCHGTQQAHLEVVCALGDLRDAVRRLAHLPSTQRRAAGTRACQSATARREGSRATNARKALGQMTHPLEGPPARYQAAGDGIHPRIAAAHCPPPHSQDKDLGSGPHAARSRLEFAELRYASVPAGQQAEQVPGHCIVRPGGQQPRDGPRGNARGTERALARPQEKKSSKKQNKTWLQGIEPINAGKPG